MASSQLLDSITEAELPSMSGDGTIERDDLPLLVASLLLIAVSSVTFTTLPFVWQYVAGGAVVVSRLVGALLGLAGGVALAWLAVSGS